PWKKRNSSMTTKPRARKFRVRRTGPDESAESIRSGDPESGSGAEGDPSPGEGQPAETGTEPERAATAAVEEIAAIRDEGLSTRQLRMARRVAQKHGLRATSDLDAVRLLRQQGIDPFKHASMLELIVPEGGGEPHE